MYVCVGMYVCDYLYFSSKSACINGENGKSASQFRKIKGLNILQIVLAQHNAAAHFLGCSGFRYSSPAVNQLLQYKLLGRLVFVPK